MNTNSYNQETQNLRTSTKCGCSDLRTLIIVHPALSFLAKLWRLVIVTGFDLASELRENKTLLDLLLPLALVLFTQFDTRPFELSVRWLLDTTITLTCFVGVIGFLVGEVRTLKTLLMFTYERFDQPTVVFTKDGGVHTAERDTVEQDRREQEVADFQGAQRDSTIATVELCGLVDCQAGRLPQVVAPQEILREASWSPFPGKPMEEEQSPQCNAQDFTEVGNIADEEESGSEDEEKTEAGNMSDEEEDEQPVVAHEILG